MTTSRLGSSTKFSQAKVLSEAKLGQGFAKLDRSADAAASPLVHYADNCQYQYQYPAPVPSVLTVLSFQTEGNQYSSLP